MYVCITSSSSVDGHLGYSYILVIVNNAAMNIGVHLSFWINVFVYFSDKYPGVELLGHMVVLFSVFGEISILFSTGAAPTLFHVLDYTCQMEPDWVWAPVLLVLAPDQYLCFPAHPPVLTCRLHPDYFPWASICLLHLSEDSFLHSLIPDSNPKLLYYGSAGWAEAFFPDISLLPKCAF